MGIIVPPIKSQGIKTKLVPSIRGLTPEYSGRWIEPFLGTGVVALNQKSSNVLANDSNPHIIRFYEDVKDRTVTPQIVREFLVDEGERLRSSASDRCSHYYRIRDRFNAEPNSLDFLFLSRAGFNGMMRFNKNGEWNVPFCKKPNRFSKSYVTKIVNQVKSVSATITLNWEFTHGDFERTIARATCNDLVYCDPPYYGRYVDYYNGWTEEDEERLFTALSNTKAKFILSTWHHNDYRANPMIEKYWGNFNLITKDHFYHTGAKIENRRSIVEATVYNYDRQLVETCDQRPTQLSIL